MGPVMSQCQTRAPAAKDNTHVAAPELAGRQARTMAFTEAHCAQPLGQDQLVFSVPVGAPVARHCKVFHKVKPVAITAKADRAEVDSHLCVFPRPQSLSNCFLQRSPVRHWLPELKKEATKRIEGARQRPVLYRFQSQSTIFCLNLIQVLPTEYSDELCSLGEIAADSRQRLAIGGKALLNDGQNGVPQVVTVKQRQRVRRVFDPL